jgi:hypothetical protein
VYPATTLALGAALIAAGLAAIRASTDVEIETVR